MEQLPEYVWAYLFIFGARIIDVSLDVIRILMLMRDKRLMAAIIGFFEVSVFVLALNEVLSGGLNDPGKILAYAGGFATGNYIGSLIEERLAMGYLSLQIIPPSHLENKFVTLFRQHGFGVTTVEGFGKKGKRLILFVTLKRKDLSRALNLMETIMPDVFFCVSDARHIKGGTFPVKKGK